ncbi:MAG: CD1871A family CXXC motif-containing protein [Desulfotomaculaceae bacterium]|nr:CD1871A family CXXC motif-containing protein [Desulfotomaculaceae bacterium]
MVKTILRLALLGASLLSVVFGASRGEVQEVLQTAINLCLECIGIG